MELSANFVFYAIGGIIAVTVIISLCYTFVAKHRFMKNTDVFRLLRQDGTWFIWHNIHGYYDREHVILLIHQGGLITREEELEYLGQLRQGTLKSISIPGGRYTDVKNITISFFKDQIGSVAIELNEDEVTHEEAYNYYKAKISSILGEGEDLGAGSSCNWRNVVLAQGNEIRNTSLVIMYLPSEEELVELGKTEGR